MELEQPAIRADDRATVEDRQLPAGVGSRLLEQCVVVRRDQLGGRQRRYEAVRQPVWPPGSDALRDGVADGSLVARERGLDHRSSVEKWQALERGRLRQHVLGELVQQRLPLGQSGARADSRTDEEDKAPAASVVAEPGTELIDVSVRETRPVERALPPPWPTANRPSPRELCSRKGLVVARDQHDVGVDRLEDRRQPLEERPDDLPLAVRGAAFPCADEWDGQQRTIATIVITNLGPVALRASDELFDGVDDPFQVRRRRAADVAEPHFAALAITRKERRGEHLSVSPLRGVADRDMTVGVEGRGDPGIAATPDIFDLHALIGGQQPGVAG